MRIARPLLLLLLLTSLQPQHAVAQRPDIRVSPDDPTTHALPAEIQIQSADEIDSRTLVVWGTTRADGDSIIPELRMQMLNGSALSGEQLRLTSEAARPGRFVQVIAFDTSFAVIWNDYRGDSSGIYLRFVGNSGAMVGSEQRISVGYVATDAGSRITALGEHETKVLLWQEYRPQGWGLYSLYIVEGIGPTGSERRLGAGLAGLRTYRALPGWTLIHTTTAGWIAVDNGRIDSRSIPKSHFSNAFYLNSDTSLVQVSGDSLLFFASVFDTEPERMLKIDALDSATENTVQIGRDSTGELAVYFAHIEITGDIYKNGYMRLNEYRIRVIKQDSLSTPEQIYSEVQETGPVAFGTDGYAITGFLGASFTSGNDNSSLVQLTWQWTEYYHQRAAGTTPINQNFSVDPFGNFDNGGSGYVQSPPLPPAVEMTRLGNTDSSSVRVDLADTLLVLHAASASWQLSIPQTLPVLYTSQGRLMTTWQYAADKTAFDLSEWDAPGGTPALLRDRVYAIDMPKPHYPNHVVLHDQYKTADNRDVVVQAPDLSLISSQKWVRDYGVIWLSPVTGDDGVFDWNRYVLRRADSSRWITLMSITNAPDYPNIGSTDRGHWEQGIPQGYDAAGELLLVEVVSFASWGPPTTVKHRTLYAFGSDGSKQWSVILDNPTAYTTILPGDSLQFIRINGLQATLYELQDTISQFTFAQPGITARYQRLLGPFFLRRYWTDSTGTDLRLEIYSLDGTLRHATTVRQHSHNDDMMILQRPADSALVIVSGGDGGVHLTALSSRLEVLAENVVISETHDVVVHPSATFRNDTLFFVWQDNRNGNADIYGNAVAWSDVVPPTIDTSEVDTSGNEPPITPRPPFVPHAPVLVPNPAANAAIVELDVEQGSAVVVELFDPLGQVVASRHVTADATRRVYLQLDLRGLPAGAYMVRYRAGAIVGVLPLRVVR